MERCCVLAAAVAVAMAASTVWLDMTWRLVPSSYSWASDRSACAYNPHRFVLLGRLVPCD